MSSRVKSHFTEAAATLAAFATDDNFALIAKAAKIMADCLANGGKIMSCGNGGSHCDAMHFAEELSGRYRDNRKALAAMAISDPSHISCVGNDYGYDFIFSRMVEALGKPNDILLGISTSGNSTNVINAIDAAQLIGMKTIVLTGKDGGQMAGKADLEIRAPHSQYADRAQEIHIKVIHSIIDSIEQELIK
jgi:D-sedoheptulose 7-phosphate isomerase